MKTGRPRLTEKQRRAFQIGVRFTRAEWLKLVRAKNRSGKTLAWWAREILLAAVK